MRNSDLVKCDIFTVDVTHNEIGGTGCYYGRTSFEDKLTNYGNILSITSEICMASPGINYLFSHGIDYNKIAWMSSTASSTSTLAITVLYTD